MGTKEAKKLTDWEVGQELIAISDEMGQRAADFKDSHPEVFGLIDELRKQIGDKFNRMGSHNFFIYAHKD